MSIREESIKDKIIYILENNHHLLYEEVADKILTLIEKEIFSPCGLEKPE